jgi:hypothetical protein
MCEAERMLNLQPDSATIWWTFDDFEILTKHRDLFPHGKTMQEDAIDVVVTDEEIKFDAPESWHCGEPTVIAFRKTPSGSYVARGEGLVYEAARLQTENTIWLLGNSRDDGLGSGTVIIGIPRHSAGVELSS